MEDSGELRHSIQRYVHIFEEGDVTNMKPKDLWLSGNEYKDNFPLDVRTEKYIATRKARGNGE